LQTYATDTLLKSLTLQVEALCIKALAPSATGGSSVLRVDGDPNNYKLPIYLAGIAALTSLGRIAPTDSSPAIKVGLKLLSARLQDNTIGALARVGAYARREPSAYHTYWAAQALTEIVSSKLVRGLVSSPSLQTAVRCLSAIRGWAESALAALIADHHAGITSRFDPIELVCAPSLASLKLEHSQTVQFLPSNEALRLAGHGLQILFAEHFSDGSLARSKPVYSDEEKNPIFCSTPEALFYLLAPSVSSSSPVGSSEVGSSISVTVRSHVGSLLILLCHSADGFNRAAFCFR
jgi:hypothetical protein